MRLLLATALLFGLAAPAHAADCTQQHAIYIERDNGYVLTFRPPKPWEASANTMAVLELSFPDGETTLWGTIWLPNGTSHDKIGLYTQDCKLPTFDPAVDIDPTSGSTVEEFEVCTVWDGVILALTDNDIGALPWFDGAAPAATLLLPNLGPVIRYSGLVLSPGDEPHDVFTLKGCG